MRLGCFCQKTIPRYVPASNCDDVDCPKKTPVLGPVGSAQGPVEIVRALSPFIPNKILGLPTLEIVQLTPCRRFHPSYRLPTLPLILADSVDVGTSPGPLPFRMLIHPESICWR